MPPRKRPRTQRREAERAARRLVHARERLAALEPGGAPDHPIDVASAGVVEVHARGLRCHQCGGSVRLDEHSADLVGDTRLRTAHVVCATCGTRRSVYFRIAPSAPN